MGGSHTETVQAPKEEKHDLREVIQRKPQQAETVNDDLPRIRSYHAQELEVHKNDAKGEVHFHDRATGLKAAVPVFVWWEKWNSLKKLEVTSWNYVDVVNKTKLTIRLGKNDDGKLDAAMTLVAYEITDSTGDTFQTLDRFTAKAGK
jgi:hypothetical protein